MTELEMMLAGKTDDFADELSDEALDRVDGGIKSSNCAWSNSGGPTRQSD
jgi:hypothetical protein